MAITNSYPYDNATNYSYTDTDIEVTGGLAQLIATVVPGSAYTYLKLDENQGLVCIDSSGNGRHGAFQGGLDTTAWVAGKIDYAIEGDGSGYVNLDDVGDFDGSSAISIEMWIKYTSATTQQLWGKQLNSGQFQGYIFNLAAGKIRAIFRDDNGKKQGRETSVTKNDGAWHHVVATYDGTKLNAGFKMYVDNVLETTETFSDDMTGSMSSAADFQLSGRDGGNGPMAVGTVADMCVVYERELTTADITFRWNSGNGTTVLPGTGTSYPINNPTILIKDNIKATTVNAFTNSVVETGSDLIKWVVIQDGADKYWNGSAFVNSSGYTESNTAAELNTNLSSLSITDFSFINFKSFLHSDDGSTTPQLLDYTFDYNFTTVAPVAVNTCIVFGYVYDVSGNPLNGVTVNANLELPSIYSGSLQISQQKEETTSNALGYWQLTLMETESMDPLIKYKFQFSGFDYDLTAYRNVPNLTTKPFAELI